MKILLSTILIFYCCALTAQTSKLGKEKFLKEYAFCQCMVKVFNNDTLFKRDASRGFYAEMLDYDVDNTNKIDSLTEKYVKDSLLFSKYQDYKGKSFLTSTCIKFYESKTLKSFIHQLLFIRKRK